MTKTTWNGVEYDILLERAGTAGAIGAFLSVDHPGYGPPRHIHEDADESFYLLAGEVEFWMGGTPRFASAGTMICVPRGTEHAFRVCGDHPARMLTIMTPGGFEGFFREVGREGLRIPEDMARIAEIGAAYHVSFTGPPLGLAA